jgi:multidrug efflux pump subunit AcrB
MFNLFFRNRQLLFLTLTLIIVWGLSAFFTLPRLEDPEITQRVSTITTFFPGASAERVESLVTDKIEDELSDIEEIETISSTSSPGVSVITVELKETVANVNPVWSKVRSQLEDATPQLPPGATEPEYEDQQAKASALIVGLRWELDTDVNYAILRRVATGLEDQIRNLPGTEKVELFGEPDEEIQVEISQAPLTRLGLTAATLSQQITASDAKVSSGELKGSETELLLEVDSALDSLDRIRQIPIQIGANGQVTQLGDIAQVTKAIQSPISDLALVEGQRAIVVAATVESNYRVDHWAAQARELLQDFEAQLSDGLGLTVILDQSQYVQQRLNGVVTNLIISSLLVIGISLVMLGWRAAVIVGTALPLSTLMVFGWMQGLNIPLHQMSVTGLIIALGLLIDNAIVVVDEVQLHLKTGNPPAVAVSQSVKHLAIPLIASTLTTVLAFIPIATSPGSVGEFIGTIGSTVILALLSSLGLSLTVIAALAGLVYRWRPLRAQSPHQSFWWVNGFSHPLIARLYRWSLGLVFRRPLVGILLALVLPGIGFIQFLGLPQQFFPPTNRDQFQIEFELPATSAIATTQAQILQARNLIRQNPDIQDVHWFVGKSAPAFFYNITSSRRNAADYAQGIVQLNSTQQIRETIQSLQRTLDAAFPHAQVLVRQLEQGPPFEAPLEVRLYGSDITQLRTLGDQLRGLLTQVPEVIHTRATLAEVSPKLALTVDEEAARRVGLDHRVIATQLNTLLNGTVGGSILEGTEDLPVRVRLPESARGNLDRIAAIDLLSPTQNATIPLSAVATVDLVPDLSTITRRNGQRINLVQGFIKAGALPSDVLGRFQQTLTHRQFQLPPAIVWSTAVKPMLAALP